MKTNNDLPKATFENYKKLQSLKENAEEFKYDDGRYLAAINECQYYENKYNWMFTRFEENDKVGVKDITGSICIPAQYDDIPFVTSYLYYRSFPLCAVKEDKAALVKTDGSGIPLTEFIYDSINLIPFTHFFVAKIDNKFKLLNKRGEFIVEDSFDDVQEPVNGLIILKSNDKYGFIDNEDFYIKPEYDEIECELDSFVRVLKDNIWGYINDKGEFTDDEEQAFYVPDM